MEYETNQMNRVQFALLHLFWGGTIHVLFLAYLFCRLKLPWMEQPLSLAASRCVLLAMAEIGTAIGFCSSLNDGRTHWRTALNVLTPYGLYLALNDAAGQSHAFLWIAALVCAGVILVVYGAILFSAPIHHKQNRAFVLEVRFFQLFSVTWLLVKTLLCLFVVVSIIASSIGLNAIRPTTDSVNCVSAAEEPGSIDQWREQLQAFQPDRWEKLSLQERTDLLQLVADIETGYLGLLEQIYVSCQTMPPNILGAYAHEFGGIVYINRDHLLYDPPKAVLETLLHEAYHAAQHYLVDLSSTAAPAYRSLIFLRPAEQYKAEFEHYNSGEANFADYFEQACERDAREYAETRLADAYQPLFSS